MYIPNICRLGNYLLADYEPNLNNDDASQVYFGHFPSGCSVKQAAHFSQAANTHEFKRFDFCTNVENLLAYGQTKPPMIDLTKISGIPVALIAGTKDHLSTVEDTRWAKKQLEKVLVHYKEYELGHLSYFIARDMSYFTKDVIKLLKQYHPII
jgi:hypothetical protein